MSVVFMKNLKQKVSTTEITTLLMCESDEEFYFAFGQLVILIMTRISDTNRFANIFLRSQSGERVKEGVCRIIRDHVQQISISPGTHRNSVDNILFFCIWMQM